MHYYQFNIADFAYHTSHLSLEEEAVYRRLLDYYYDREAPIPKETDSVIRRLRLVNYSEIVSAILSEFFVLTDNGWVNYRADAEILAYHAKAEAARENGKKGGRPKKNNGLHDAKTQSVILANQEETESKANQEPRTINQEPRTKNHLDYSCWPQLPSDQTLQDWLSMRKRLKANVSQTVINRYAKELEKAVSIGYTVDFCLQECVTRNWRGFECQWLINNGAQYGNNKQSFGQRDTRDRAARAADAAFGSDEGVFEGSFTRIDPHGLIE